MAFENEEIVTWVDDIGVCHWRIGNATFDDRVSVRFNRPMGGHEHYQKLYNCLYLHLNNGAANASSDVFTDIEDAIRYIVANAEPNVEGEE